jgi:hypothetical protein
MKGLCYLSNMVIPGVGTLIIKHWRSGIIQTVLSLVAWGLIIPGLIQVLRVWEKVKEMNEQALAEDFQGAQNVTKEMGSMLTDNIVYIVLCTIGVILLKVTLIWSQASAVKYFRELKKAEAEAVEIDQVEDDS